MTDWFDPSVLPMRAFKVTATVRPLDDTVQLTREVTDELQHAATAAIMDALAPIADCVVDVHVTVKVT